MPWDSRHLKVLHHLCAWPLCQDHWITPPEQHELSLQRDVYMAKGFTAKRRQRRAFAPGFKFRETHLGRSHKYGVVFRCFSSHPVSGCDRGTPILQVRHPFVTAGRSDLNFQLASDSMDTMTDHMLTCRTVSFSSTERTWDNMYL